MKLESEFHKKMDSQTKLTRTNSSLLRSSPTIRSSIHSLSSVNEIAPRFRRGGSRGGEALQQAASTSGSLRCGGACGRRLPPPLRALRTTAFLLLYALSALIFVEIFLFLLSRNKGFVSRNVKFFKQICDEYGNRLGFLHFVSRTRSKPVQWFIGEAESEELESRKIVWEGVECYNNGDYAGEFHKGRVT